MPDIELTVKQAARDLQITPRAVRMALEAGKLRGRKVPGKFGDEWRISPQCIRDFSADRQRGSEEDELGTSPWQQGNDDFLAAVDAVAGEVRSVREENAEYRGHLERLTLQIEGLTRALPPAQEERERLERTITEATEALGHLGQHVQRQADENAARADGIEALRRLVQAQSAEIAELRAHSQYERGLASWQALPWRQRRKTPRPEPTNIPRGQREQGNG